LVAFLVAFVVAFDAAVFVGRLVAFLVAFVVAFVVAFLAGGAWLHLWLHFACFSNCCLWGAPGCSFGLHFWFLSLGGRLVAFFCFILIAFVVVVFGRRLLTFL